MVIGQDPQLREELVKFFHSANEGGHSGATATMKRLGSAVY